MEHPGARLSLYAIEWGVVQFGQSSASTFPASSRRPAFSPAGRGISRKHTAVRAKLHHCHGVKARRVAGNSRPVGGLDALQLALAVLLALRHDGGTKAGAEGFGQFVKLGVAINLDGLL